MNSMRFRTWLARVGCICILLGAFQPFYLRMLTPARARFARGVIELPYQQMPGLRVFLEGVAVRTQPGDWIAIAVPATKWEEGYGYAFKRSAYALAGRVAVPLLDEHDQPLPGNLARSRYIAAWRSAPAVPGFEKVWQSPDGVLLRRVK